MGLSDKSSVSAKRGETRTAIIFATATRFSFLLMLIDC